MSRHRDVRNMDYTEDYDGYDDVYGHSVDDDYYISPSNRQFIYNRESSRDQPKIGEFIRTEQDIQEEDESEVAADLSDLDKVKLESCIEQIKTTLGPLNISKNELANIVIAQHYDVEKAINAVLNDVKSPQVDRKEKGVTKNSSKFFIPKLNGLNTHLSDDKLPLKQFNIPSILKFNSSESTSVPKTFMIPKINNFSQTKSESSLGENKTFDNLSELVSSHLSKSFKSKLSINSSDKVTKITQNIESLKLAPLSSDVDSSSNQYQIDLSVALKPSSSVQNVSSKSKTNLREEKFEIPFVDCDVELETKTVLKSSFDVKDILQVYLNNVKPVSNFGKVLCHKFKRRCHVKIKSHDIGKRKLKTFNFATPSPDDSIIKHLRH